VREPHEEILMNRYVSTQLMTIEEAQQLSDVRTSREADRERQRNLWSWQNVAGAMSMTITDEQFERLAATATRRHDK
jgi:hypothetical protein